MPSINISLPEEMVGLIRSRVEDGDYLSGSEYVRDLVRRDQERLVNEGALERALIEGAVSGASDRSVLDIMADVEAKMGADHEL